MEQKKRTRTRKASPPPEAVDLEVTETTAEPDSNPKEKRGPEMTTGDDPHKNGNRYAPKMKVGTPTIGRSPQFVQTVGLGNLQVTTNGKRNYN